MTETQALIALIDERIFAIIASCLASREAVFVPAEFIPDRLTPGQRLELTGHYARLFAELGLDVTPALGEGLPTQPRAVTRRLSAGERVEFVETLVRDGENGSVEFKSSLYYSHKGPAGSPFLKQDELRDEVLGAVCAFLNTEGGIVLVGVDPSGEVLGIEHDFGRFTVPPRGSMGCDKWCEQLMNDFGNFSVPDIARSRVDVRMVVMGPEKTVAVLSVQPSPRLMSLRVKLRTGGEAWLAFARRNSRTVTLLPHDIEEYVLARVGRSSLGL
ncbi:MAG: helix-turn-helix domain-containing protein [Planctomycetota bacterium]